jgi:hypothetical protein
MVGSLFVGVSVQTSTCDWRCGLRLARFLFIVYRLNEARLETHSELR